MPKPRPQEPINTYATTPDTLPSINTQLDLGRERLINCAERFENLAIELRTMAKRLDEIGI